MSPAGAESGNGLAMNAAQVIRFGGPRRNFLLLLLVCLATFVGVIVLFRGDAPAPPATDLTQTVDEDVQTALPPASQAPRMAPTSMAFASSRPNSDPLAHRIAAQALGSDDADSRAAAIRELDPGTDDSLAALEQTVRGDPIARNRLLAVNGLRFIAKGGRSVAEVRVVLQAAQADDDPNVAASARDALQELAP